VLELGEHIGGLAGHWTTTSLLSTGRRFDDHLDLNGDVHRQFGNAD
jgi:hypothetical protein